MTYSSRKFVRIRRMDKIQCHVNMGKVEIVTRAICTTIHYSWTIILDHFHIPIHSCIHVVLSTVFSIGVLVPAAITLLAVDKVEDILANEYSVEYQGAASYRRAAECLVFIGVAVILCHVTSIIIRILYIISVMERHFNLYVYKSAVLCVFFILSLLSGGIANSIFAAENGKLWSDNCHHISFHSSAFCQNLQRVTDSEAASAAMSFLSLISLVILFFIMIGSHLSKMCKSGSREESCPSPDELPTYDSLHRVHPPSYESVIAMSYTPPVDAPLYDPEAHSAP